MKRTTIDIWVGIFVAIGALSIAFLALKVASQSRSAASDTYALYADFDNIGGLKPKAAVRSAGVVVGRVADIRFDDERYQARIDLDMDTRFKFPKDSALKILTSGLLGEQYIGIEAGASDQNLAAGDNVTATQSAVVLENLISQFLYNSAANNASSGGSGK